MENILILHGWGSSAKNWSRVREILESNGYKVFVPEFPGFGDNPPPSQPWSIDDYVDWVKRYIDNLQTRGEFSEPFFLLGHSFGGTLAVRLASYSQKRIKALILVAPKLKRYKTWKYYISLVLAKMGKWIFSSPGLSFFQPLGRKVLYTIIGTNDYFALEIQKAVTMKETFKKVVGVDSTFYLPSIKIPTLIVWGSKDVVTPLKDAYLIHKEIKDSKLEIIRNGRHALNLGMAETLAEKILNFIKFIK